ncbi:VanZ family protein [Gracilibacillus oryzae]|uniref:VanZ family protein n=1 Tax=Gracilibacillus oryzae TaxID=1672701 RepID=A0A7C8GQL4_9BACI|nr:VanZ family protein [Gracilibacillus oryzae]KAB8126362.1 VanZ family protein [Gracilibacillus oryzae]
MYKYLSWIAVIVCMGFIFYLSHQPATTSNQLSTGVTHFIINLAENIFPDVSNAQDVRLNSKIRKFAHFFIYFIFSLLVMYALQKSRKGSHLIQHVFLTITICISYAVLDEMHQLFIIGRGAQITDVFIDSLGVFSGIFVYLLTSRRTISNER